MSYKQYGPRPCNIETVLSPTVHISQTIFRYHKPRASISDNEYCFPMTSDTADDKVFADDIIGSAW